MLRRSAWMCAAVTSLALVAGCGPDDETLESELKMLRQGLVAGCTLSSVDGDADGLDDGLENCLLQRHAPVLYLPWTIDWARPANVDWYLSRVHMRFSHDDCPDCAILALGSVTQTNLSTRSHAEKNWYCSHTNTTRLSGGNTWVENETFFLQPPDDTTHNGSTNPADWKVYGHVYKNSLGGVNVQYWYFFPYNDFVASFNHEADWEHINVRLGADYAIQGVHFAHHKTVSYYAKADVQWYDANRPYVWIADGSHASYRSEEICDSTFEEAGFGASSCETNASYRWFTAAGTKGTQSGFQGGGVLNVGEKTRPLNNQHFLKYNSRWGELGATSATNGVRGPSFNGNWLHDT